MVDLNTSGPNIFPPRSVPRTQYYQGFLEERRQNWRKEIVEEIYGGKSGFSFKNQWNIYRSFP